MLLKNGSTGTYVTYLQYGLHIMCCYSSTIDGTFGDNTETAVVKYQNSKSITADGKVGDTTWSYLKADISNIQQLLKNNGYTLSVDGIAGKVTYNAVISFQTKSGLTADGMVGSKTLAALKTESSRSSGTSTLQSGSSGTYVYYLQYGLRIMCCYSNTIDGTFGDSTKTAVIKYQKSKSLNADGIVGTATWAALKANIKLVQQALNEKDYELTVDGIAGSATYNAVLSFQTLNGLTADGMVGSATWAALGSSNSNSSNDTSYTPAVPSTGCISNALVEFIKSYEGFSSTPYYDASNVLTIGYGSTSGWIISYSSVTKAQATQALMEDINSMAAKIKTSLDSNGVTLTQNEFDALASFAYNCGVSALLSQSTLYKNVCAGVRDESTIRTNFTAWCHSNGEVLQGLLNRRNEECDMFFYGDYNRDL